VIALPRRKPADKMAQAARRTAITRFCTDRIIPLYESTMKTSAPGSV